MFIQNYENFKSKFQTSGDAILNPRQFSTKPIRAMISLKSHLCIDT